MVYKITYDLNASMTSFFNSLNNYGNFILVSNTIYLNSDIHKRDLINQLSLNLTEDEQIMVKTVELDSYDYPKQIEYWMSKIKQERKKVEFEQQRQEQIKKALNFLDNLEIELNKQLEERGGDVGSK